MRKRKSRIIGGKRYSPTSTPRSKAAAKRSAKQDRSLGVPSRVVRVGKKYIVYSPK